MRTIRLPLASTPAGPPAGIVNSTAFFGKWHPATHLAGVVRTVTILAPQDTWALLIANVEDTGWRIVVAIVGSGNNVDTGNHLIILVDPQVLFTQRNGNVVLSEAIVRRHAITGPVRVKANTLQIVFTHYLLLPTGQGVGDRICGLSNV